MIRFLSVYPPAPILKQQFSFIHIRWPGLKAKKKPALRAVTAGFVFAWPQCLSLRRREHGKRRKASRAMDGAGRAARDWRKRLSDLTVFLSQSQSYNRPG